MTNKFNEKQAYMDMLSEEFVNAPNAPAGAMSSGPEVDALMRPSNPNDQKFSIYNLVNPKKKKQFESKEDAEDFMKEEPDKWTWEIKESISSIEYNVDLMKENPELHNKLLKLKEQAEHVEYECRAWLQGYFTEAMKKVKSSNMGSEFGDWKTIIQILEKNGFKNIKLDDNSGEGTVDLGSKTIKFSLGSENFYFELPELYTKSSPEETVKLIKKFIKDIDNWR
jgi:hypothetical protein